MGDPLVDSLYYLVASRRCSLDYQKTGKSVAQWLSFSALNCGKRVKFPMEFSNLVYSGSIVYTPTSPFMLNKLPEKDQSVRHRRLCCGLFLMTLFSLPIFSFAQSQIKFEQLTLEDGMSQSTVNSICQDSRGFMWIGTDDGLCVRCVLLSNFCR